MPRPQPQHHRHRGLAPLRRPPVRRARHRRHERRRAPRESRAVLDPGAVQGGLRGPLAGRSLVLRAGRRHRHRLPGHRDGPQLRRRRRRVSRPQARDMRHRRVRSPATSMRRDERRGDQRQGAPRQRRVRKKRGAVGKVRDAQRRSTRLRAGQGPTKLVLLQVSPDPSLRSPRPKDLPEN